jgi:hypothetical protein
VYWQTPYRQASAGAAINVLRRVALVLFFMQRLPAEKNSRRANVMADVD